MIFLSPQTKSKIGILFNKEVRKEVEELLEIECGATIPFCEENSPEDMERIRFAALKVSGGNIDKLYEAIALAQKDWRDLLVSAEFADDIEAHTKWSP